MEWKPPLSHREDDLAIEKTWKWLKMNEKIIWPNEKEWVIPDEGW